ncbi:methyl-accepting chemotaxis protein [Yoonia sp. SS1-5]|uniref:Methyl-accepting chemotaxis protein n=1 Tax=Yoonia rhodophyticola TaxID=3137370 RepID=A0AAN0M6U5_9RHOB
MLQLSINHQTTPAYYEPEAVKEDSTQHRLRVIIDEIATTRGLTIQMSLRIMSIAAAPDDESAASPREEFNAMAAQFGTNMDLLYGASPHDGVPTKQLEWIRKIAARAPKRREKMKAVQKRILAAQDRLNGGGAVTFKEARKFYEDNWVTVRDEMTGMIWDLWADLDAQKADALADLDKLRDTLTNTLGDIKRISFAVRMIALNTAVMASRAGDAGAGFSIIATEVRQLAEQIQSSANRAESVVGSMKKPL